MKDCKFTLEKGLAPEGDGEKRLLVVTEAFQVIECAWMRHPDGTDRDQPGQLTKLEPSSAAGITRYLSGEGTPAFAERFLRILSYGTVIPLIATGIIVWIRQKTPLLFISGFLMFAFSAIGPATGNFDLIFLIGMFGGLFMVLFFLLYGKKTV